MSGKKNRHTMNDPSQRQLRVGEQVRHELSQLLQRGHFKDPSLVEKSALITVTEVRLTPDLKHAKAYVLPLGGKQSDIDELLPALNEEAKTFQSELGHALKMKFTPRVQFVTDHSFGEADRIEHILHNIKKDHPNTDGNT